jgi:hypothetical protein
MLNMRRVLYAVAAASVFTFVPLVILRLESTTELVKLLKDIAAALGVPGAAVGFIVAAGRIHDVDSGVSDAANFAFYFVAVWLLLKAVSLLKTRRTTQRSGLVDR